jgi:hypothetical protein
MGQYKRGIPGELDIIKQIYIGGRYCEIHKSTKDKMAGPCENNGSWGNAKKNGGRKTVYRKKGRKTSFEMDGRCSSRFDSNEDRTVDREGRG